jgi:hypothetical protein
MENVDRERWLITSHMCNWLLLRILYQWIVNNGLPEKERNLKGFFCLIPRSIKIALFENISKQPKP